MYRQSPAPVRVFIAAENPVVLAGLRKVAAVVGLSETMIAGEEDFYLRSVSAAWPSGAVDVNCSGETVVVTVQRRPTPEVWTLILDLVEQVLPTTSSGTTSTEHRP